MISRRNNNYELNQIIKILRVKISGLACRLLIQNTTMHHTVGSQTEQQNQYFKKEVGTK